jgi:F-type H+-transporting ATPase subunit delta
MNQSKIVVRYSKALYSLAKDKVKIEEVKKDMELIFSTCQRTKEFMEMVMSPVIRSSEKYTIFKNIFENKICQETMSFLSLLCQNKRESYIKDISRYFVDLYRADNGIKSVMLTTAVPVDEEIKNEIIGFVTKKYNTKVQLATLINPDILGGYILKIDDQQYDASIISGLKKIRQEFLDYSFQIKL